MDTLIEPGPTHSAAGRRGRLGAALGAASLLLLGAALLWAHP